MASLNLSTNGPSIQKSYQSVVNSVLPSGAAASSPTYGQWAVFSVSAPLANAFQDSGNKESVLKVQSSGEGELVDLIEEFSDGRVQFAYVKIKDSNTGLPKNALIAWCGEGVPERTKGYFANYLTAVQKLLQGYHVQITARSEQDLTPESIVRKVADASGSKYSAGNTQSGPPPPAATKPAISAKPAFTPTQSTSLPARPARRTDPNADADGWGADAPEITRRQLEKVESAYKPTRVNMRDLQQGRDDSTQDDRPGVISGAYKPIGKVDIAEIRRQAKESGQLKDERPEIVKGSYEPIGKVDIAAIRARAQPQAESVPEPEPQEEAAPSLTQRSAAFSQPSGPERLTSMPKPKIANRFGASSTFTGTKAPSISEYGYKAPAPAAPVGTASKTFADEGGKTPAQIWAEKKARQGGGSTTAAIGGAAIGAGVGAAAISAQKSGGWDGGYTGKKWAAVETNKTGKSDLSAQGTGEAAAEEEREDEAPSGGIGSIRDRFANAAPMGTQNYERAAPPPPQAETRPGARGVPIPGMSQTEETNMPVPPPAVPRSPTPEPDEEPSSPIRIAQPISKAAPVPDLHEEVHSPPAPMPTASLARAATQEQDEEEPETGADPARHVAQSAAAVSQGHEAVDTAGGQASGGPRARAAYDYDAAEENEVSFTEGEILTDIQKVDTDWWLVTNAAGQQGLVPANYLEEVEDESAPVPAAAARNVPQAASVPEPVHAEPTPAADPDDEVGATATAMYDYEAGEDNEISFPEKAKITNITFPDADWWMGEYNGKQGLFPAAYVELEQ